MNNEYLARAREVMPDAKELIVVASRRARSLALGARPMVRCNEQNSMKLQKENSPPRWAIPMTSSRKSKLSSRHMPEKWHQ